MLARPVRRKKARDERVEEGRASLDEQLAAQLADRVEVAARRRVGLHERPLAEAVDGPSRRVQEALCPAPVGVVEHIDRAARVDGLKKRRLVREPHVRLR